MRPFVAGTVQLGIVDIGNVNDGFTAHDTRPSDAERCRYQSKRILLLDKTCPAMHGDESEKLAVINSELAVDRFAKASGLFKHFIEYRGEVAGRGIDDLQHLGGRG